MYDKQTFNNFWWFINSEVQRRQIHGHGILCPKCRVREYGVWDIRKRQSIPTIVRDWWLWNWVVWVRRAVIQTVGNYGRKISKIQRTTLSLQFHDLFWISREFAFSSCCFFGIYRFLNSVFYKRNTKWLSVQDTLIQTLGKLLHFREATIKHSPSDSCFRYGFLKSRIIPRIWIRVSCTENQIDISLIQIPNTIGSIQ